MKEIESDSIERAVESIEANLSNEINLDTIAAQVGYSKFHFNRIFLEVVGCTIYQYIKLRRITRAAQELTTTQKPIAEIAYEACYQSQQAFSQAFKQVYQLSPLLYRKQGVFMPAQLPYRYNKSIHTVCMRGRAA